MTKLHAVSNSFCKSSATTTFLNASGLVGLVINKEGNKVVLKPREVACSLLVHARNEIQWQISIE